MPSDASQSDTQPARFGRFRTTSDGQVRDDLLDRAVTLRSVPAEQADELATEARFLARLHGPGLPCVHDFVRDESGAAMVIPAFSGMSLSAAIAARSGRQRVPAIASPAACCLLGIALCDALDAAHRSGVVHGDLSPDCIFLSDDGPPVIEGWNTAQRRSERPRTRTFRAGIPTAPTRADGLHQDLRDLGECLHTAITGVPPGGEAGAAPLPVALKAILARAEAASAAQGYGSAAELRADLLRYLEGQTPLAIAAEQGGFPWRAAAALLLLLLLAGGMAAALNWRSLSSYATWGAPLVEEDFANDAWKSRWGARGRWSRVDGRMVSHSEWDCSLILKQRLSPPVAIEYTGRFTASAATLGDLSVWWCESDPFTLRPEEDVDNSRAWFVQAGAFQNSWGAIWQTPERLRLEVNDVRLEADRDYRFRVEIMSDRLTMWIDGKQVLEHRPLLPIGSGNIALYTWDSGKAFDDVRIWQQALPDLVPPLIAGDELARAGHFADAAAAYARVATAHAGKPLGNEALYRQGLALHQADSPALARKTWQALPEGPLRRRADCLAVESVLAEGDLPGAIARFTSLWQERPDQRDVLRERWQFCAQQLRRQPQQRTERMLAWIKLRDATFPEDRASRWQAAEMLNLAERWDEMISRFPDEHRLVARAMVAAGRNAELLAAPWAQVGERYRAMHALGDITALVDKPDLEYKTRSELLCKLGRFEESAKIEPYPAQLYLGGVEDLLARGAIGLRVHNALMALGRFDEAAGAGVAGSPLSGGYPPAMLYLGRFDEAERKRVDATFYRILDHLANGRTAEAQALRPRVTFSGHRAAYSGWFGRIVGVALVDEALGTPGALRQGLERGASITSGYGQRSALVCGAALDAGKEAQVAGMVWRTEAEAWVLVAQALRAELAGERPAALAAWQAFRALPPIKRLLQGHSPSIELECVAKWRIAALAK